MTRGENPVAKDSYGKSALDYARAAGRSDVCEMLVRLGGELGDWRRELENKAWKNNWPAAKQKAEEVLRVFPDDVDALFYYGVGCGASGDLGSPEKCLSLVANKRPKHYGTWYAYQRNRVSGGRWTAEKLLEEGQIAAVLALLESPDPREVEGALSAARHGHERA